MIATFMKTRGRLLVLILCFSKYGTAEQIDISRDGSPAFSYELLIARAALIAQEPFSSLKVDGPFNTISPEAWARIRFKQDNMPWSRSPFNSSIQLDYPAPFFPDVARVFWVDKGVVQEIPFQNDLFVGISNRDTSLTTPGNGFSGLHYLASKSNREPDKTSWLMFLGDRSIRAKTSDGSYGTFARPVDVRLKSRASLEQIPRFTEYYLEQNQSPDTPEVLYAVMDGTALSGVFRFESSRSQREIRQDVEATLFIRRTVESIDLIPLVTSFAFSETEKERRSDIRPEVHDADGLLVHQRGGKWLWRPLNTVKSDRTTIISVSDLDGFGLLQRDRDPEHYLDAASPQYAPNVWIEPIEAFGPGELRLVEQSKNGLATENVSLAWRPLQIKEPGSAMHLHYRISWTQDDPLPQQFARCESTHIGRLITEDGHHPKDSFRFHIVYKGNLPASAQSNNLTLKATTSRGKVLAKKLVQLDQSDQFHVDLDVQIPSNDSAELELHIADNEKPIAESWRYSFNGL